MVPRLFRVLYRSARNICRIFWGFLFCRSLFYKVFKLFLIPSYDTRYRTPITVLQFTVSLLSRLTRLRIRNHKTFMISMNNNIEGFDIVQHKRWDTTYRIPAVKEKSGRQNQKKISHDCSNHLVFLPIFFFLYVAYMQSYHHHRTL